MDFDLLFSISIYILYFVFVFLKQEKCNRLINLVLFSIICCPGLFIGDTLINICDFIIPIVFLLNLSDSTRNIGKYKIIKPLIVYFICIVLSLLSAFVFSYVSFQMLLRSFRFLNIILSMLFVYNDILKRKNKDYVLKWVGYFSFLLCFLSLILFFKQDSQFASIQYMWIGNLVLHRAGGIYKESSNLGFSMFLISLFSLNCIKNNYHKLFNYSLLFFSVIINMLSYTRITNIATIIILVLFFLQKPSKKTVVAVFVSVITLLILYYSIPIINGFINNRLLALFKNSLSDSSSGRFDVWKDSFNLYLSNGRLFFGLGYKMDDFFTDNCYLFTLTSTGIIGFLCFTSFLFSLLFASKNKKDRFMFLLCFVGFGVISLTCDVITYYRGMIYLLILCLLFDTSFSRVKCQTCGLDKLSNSAQSYIVLGGS